MRCPAARSTLTSVVLALAVLAAAQPAAAKTVHFRAAAVHAGKLVFPVRGVKASAVTRAVVRMRGHRRVRVGKRYARSGVRHGRILVRLRRLGFRHRLRSPRLVMARRKPKLIVRTDTTPPDTTISSGPPVSASSTAATFAFASSESGSRFECRSDGAAWSGCASPWSGTYPDGAHLFEVRAIDAAGNVDATPAGWSWTVASAAVPPPPTEPPPPSAGPPPPDYAPPPPSGPVYFVSPSGSDSNAGTEAAPWRTLAKATAAAGEPGSTIYAMPGTYAEDAALSRPGAAAAPITLRATAAGGVTIRSVTLRASHVRLDSVSVAGAGGHCVTVAPALTDVTVSRSAIGSCGRDGIRFTRPENTGAAYTTAAWLLGNTISGVGKSNTEANDITIYADRATVAGNDLSGTPNDAINMWGDGHTYSANVIHDLSNPYGNHNDAFQTWTGFSPSDGAQGKPITNLVIERNVIRNITGGNAHCGIAEGPGHANWTIRSNLFWNTGSICWILDTNETTTNPPHPGIAGALVYNNTFVRAGSMTTVEFNSQTTGRFVNNLLYNAQENYYPHPGNVVRDYNFYGGTTPVASEPHGRRGDPLVVDPAGDFRLQASSPAVDAGDNGVLVSPVRAVDLLGAPTARVVDVGAYEAP